MTFENMEACMLEGPDKLTEDDAQDIVQKWCRQKERRIRISSQ
jgi:hypothetical protein